MPINNAVTTQLNLEYVDNFNYEIKLGNVLRGEIGGLDLKSKCNEFNDTLDKTYAPVIIKNAIAGENITMEFYIEEFEMIDKEGNRHILDWATGTNDKPALSFCKEYNSEAPITVKEQNYSEQIITTSDDSNTNKLHNRFYFSGKVAPKVDMAVGEYKTTLTIKIIW